jgi:hypothetical protein
MSLAASLLSGCTTDRASQAGARLESTPIDWGVSADVSVDASRKLTGSAKKTRILFFTVEAPTRFIDGVFISTQGGDYEDLKSAAAYEAVYGKADVLVNPQWVVHKEDYLLFSVTQVTVTGHPGTILAFRNSPGDRRGVQGVVNAPSPDSRAFATPTLPSPRTPSSLAPATDASATRLNLTNAAAERAMPLQIMDLASGSGPSAEAGDMVSYHYTCRLEDGTTVFDSRGQGGSRERRAGSTTAPAGLGQTLVGAKTGMHRRVVIPPELGYGTTGLPSSKIPPHATLVMDLYVDQVTVASR